jgi:hypothetical protein
MRNMYVIKFLHRDTHHCEENHSPEDRSTTNSQMTSNLGMLNSYRLLYLLVHSYSKHIKMQCILFLPWRIWQSCKRVNLQVLLRITGQGSPYIGWCLLIILLSENKSDGKQKKPQKSSLCIKTATNYNEHPAK